jgi:uncharacterized sulfatase
VPKDIGTNGLDDPQTWQKVVNPRGRDCDDEDKIFSIIKGERDKLKVGGYNFGSTLSWLASEGTDEEMTDGKIATETINLLEAKQNKSFFLGMGFFRPHTPYVAPKKYFDEYPTHDVKLPVEPANERANKPPVAFTVNPPNYGISEDLQKKAKQAYIASISLMDAQVGRVLDALDRLNLTDRTLVIFISDHGYNLGEHGQWQKMLLFEESASVPMIFAVPGTKNAGKTTVRLAELVDLHPTVADLCGLPAPKDLQGVSLRPVLEDPDRPWMKAAFTQAVHQIGGGRLERGKQETCMGRSIRTEQYRYTEWSEGKDGAELYDHQADPREWHNLADAPKSADVVCVRKALLHGGWHCLRA